MRDRLRLILTAIGFRSGWCRHDFNYVFGWQRFSYATWWPGTWLYRLSGWLKRVFYTAKVIVCLVSARRDNLWALDGIEVASWGMRSWHSMDFPGTAYDWDVLVVTPGLRRWRYDSFETSSA